MTLGTSGAIFHKEAQMSNDQINNISKNMKIDHYRKTAQEALQISDQLLSP